MNKPSDVDPQTVAAIQSALSLNRAGKLAEAKQALLLALAQGGDVGLLRGMLGVLCCQSNDLVAGIEHLQAAHSARPDDLSIIGNLTTALIETGQAEAAVSVCRADAAERDGSGRLWRLRGFVLQVAEQFEEAASAYERVVASNPDDFESWNNLGNARAASGAFAPGIQAIERAAQLRPDVAPIRLNLAATLRDAGRADEAIKVLQDCVAVFPHEPKAWTELSAALKDDGADRESLEALKQAAVLDPDNVDIWVELGKDYVSNWMMAEGEEAFCKALTLDPKHSEANTMLAFVFEHLNRTEAFPALIAAAENARADPGTIAFVRAMLCRRERRFEEGLAILKEKPASVEPVRSAQMEGQFHDRLGDADKAFAAFSEMNQLQRLDPSDPPGRAAQYRAKLAADRAIVTRPWYAGWRKEAHAFDLPAPVVLLGFPRSGTTLLDTFLMGHPEIDVMEERPVIRAVEQALGPIDGLATLGQEELDALRQVYFAEAANWQTLRSGGMLIDKNPLHLNKLPILHRLFPNARFILALRHPCDVVLSCFITNFRLNNAMSNFTDLKAAAELYAESFGFWDQCLAIMPLKVHEVRYENMVVDQEAELRSLFDFLGLAWHEDALDHQQTAARRGIISTASYAQVTEPIYERAAGRWERYRDQLEPVLPILRPWIERFGYEL